VHARGHAVNGSVRRRTDVSVGVLQIDHQDRGSKPAEFVVVSLWKDLIMLYTIAIVLLVLWLLGLVSSYTLGGYIHILLVIALVMVVINLINGRRSL
jgi:hypothetical protein